MSAAVDPRLIRLRAALCDRARVEGFAAIGVTTPQAIPQAPGRLAAFVEKGLHGQMGWMAERMDWRGDPAALWPDARSIIMLAETYAPDHDPREVLGLPDHGAISVYAQGKDYHDIVKGRLKRLGTWLIGAARKAGHDAQIKVFVDTAPVMEKPLAQAAGLGWQGKHTNLLSRDLGNWFFLGAIFTTLPLPADTPEITHCGSCTACLTACPTQAFIAPYQLDARRCISYLTIEHHGPVDPALRPMLGNRIFGCDDCLAACPWNKFAQSGRDARLAGAAAGPLADLAALDDTAFRARFAGTPVKRIGRDRFIRNVLYAIGNSGQPDLAPVARRLTADPDPTVQDAAAWALTRLRPQ
ncbi:tRNA epoxyqueuosine(34) reductase QueG [Paracoccus sp. p4-l81]|uniref:tRNA epoxyqueuosine(34) reductase QueG n=1 Tax=Paracoccus sp. p4-l81 TaxID=3342806 RepID=UPI0035B91E27